jgi:hypothetical protein
MASKIFSVVKNGKVLKELKTLASAKKAAEAENAEVFADGECVYSPVSDPAEAAVVTAPAEEAVSTEEKTVQQKNPEKYILLQKMNVRKAPSLKAEKLGTKAKNTVVEAVLEDDWLHLTDGTFILYDGGKFAKRA